MTQKAETIILRGATIIDGSGAPAGALELDCSGLVVAPGFIDIHSHSDFSLFLDPGAPNYVAQGVTLLVNGNCGTSGAPIDAKDSLTAQVIGDECILRLITWSSFAEYMETLDRLPKAVNLAAFVGRVNARVTALGVSGFRPASSTRRASLPPPRNSSNWPGSSPRWPVTITASTPRTSGASRTSSWRPCRKPSASGRPPASGSRSRTTRSPAGGTGGWCERASTSWSTAGARMGLWPS